jgi:hypothetical protein
LARSGAVIIITIFDFLASKKADSENITASEFMINTDRPFDLATTSQPKVGKEWRGYFI